MSLSRRLPVSSRVLMVQGCTSSAGKSYLTAAVCRILANRGVKVAPFKAQNMSNNAGVTVDGLEMGRAQIVQAAAARVRPDVRMNPVLIKPEADMRSQVVVLGRARQQLSSVAWHERRPLLWDAIRSSLHSLLADHDVVVIEGAGSPAEINLRHSDVANMSVALEGVCPPAPWPESNRHPVSGIDARTRYPIPCGAHPHSPRAMWMTHCGCRVGSIR